MEKFVKGKGKKNEGEGRAEYGIRGLNEVEGHIIEEANLTTNGVEERYNSHISNPYC